MKNKPMYDRTKESKISNKGVIGIRCVRLISSIIDHIVMIILILLLVYGMYSVIDTKQIYTQASYTQYEQYKPISEADTLSFETLQEINNEVFAWLTVYGTRIDYPVAHNAEDNNKYVNTDITGKYSLAGSIYLASKNNKNFSDFNSIIYGHHMNEGAMFGDLDKFKEQDFFQSRRYGNLYFEGKNHGIEFFAYLSADAYDWNIYNPGLNGSDEEKQAYIVYLLEQATYTREVDVSIANQIILLSTCSADQTNGRDILVGKLSDEIYSNNFAMESQDDKRQVSDTQVIKEWVGELTSWGWITVLLIIILILILLILLESFHNKKKIRGGEKIEKAKKL